MHFVGNQSKKQTEEFKPENANVKNFTSLACVRSKLYHIVSCFESFLMCENVRGMG